MRPEPVTPLRARRDLAPREAVEALHDLADILSALIDEFSALIDKSTLLDAMEKVLHVALAHDELGGYHVYPAIDAEDVAAEGQP